LFIPLTLSGEAKDWVWLTLLLLHFFDCVEDAFS
jgi:hypothetical protein